MDLDSSGMLEVAALGRPFRLGMLYDCRKDSLITGLTLWDREDLVNNISERPQSYNECDIVASESIEVKSSSLHVDASLKASFLVGLVKVSGSAKYLNDNKTSKHQARVTLKYYTTTKFEELTMNHLGRGNVKHPYVFDKGLATHVVTGILYGAQAFFVFDQTMSNKEKDQDIESGLKMLVKKIPSIETGGKGSLQMKAQDKANVERFACKFHGDFCLEKSPVSYQDAVEVYQSLPKLLGPSGEKAVPMKVWLLPLTILDSCAAKLVRQISRRLVKETQNVLEEFLELEIRCNDAVKATTAQQFPQIIQKVKRFQELCSGFKQEFQQTLENKLPLIRGGRENEAELAVILKKICSSPFNSKSLNTWMDCKEKEVHFLKSFTNKMINTKIVSSQRDLDEEVFSTEHAVCFVFTSLDSAEPYLYALQNHLEKHNSENPAEPQPYDIEKEQWYLSKGAIDTLRHKAKLFIDFAETNKNINIKFLAVGLTDDTHKGSSIYLYKDGFLVTDNFEPPSKPQRVTVSDVNYNSVTLKISPPKFGAAGIASYGVEYCVCGEDGWQQITASKAEEVTVNGLSPNTEYMFRCRAVTAVGLGPAAEVGDPIKTLPCSPPRMPQTDSNSSEISVSWEKPAEIGQDVHILSYVVEYTRMDGTDKVHLQWNQMVSGGEKAIISGLQSETGYAVRLQCDCGVDGRSKESVTINVSTTKYTSHLTDVLKQTCEKINSDTPSVWKLPLKEEHGAIRGCRRYSFGEENNRQNRTVILCGSGRLTLINGMVNYILGVKWEDSDRFRLVDEGQGTQAECQTSKVKVYRINHQEGFQIPYSLTIIDIPDSGDTRGIGTGRKITRNLHRLFTNESGVSEIHLICFVAQSALARLTPTQKHTFDSVLSIFGKDVAENIRILVTLADGQRPPVLGAISASGVPCPKSDGLPAHFKFNNSALFAHNQSSDDDDGGFDEMVWNTGFRSMRRFFAALNQIKTKSLTMTNKVLLERQQLLDSVVKLQREVKLGLNKLEEIKETTEKLLDLEGEICRNENVKFEVTVKFPFQKDSGCGGGRYFTNCQQCHHTCHEASLYKRDEGQIKCPSMDPDGHCTVCPGKCHWNVHFNQEFKWEYMEVKQMRRVKDLMEKYQVPIEAEKPVQVLISNLMKEYNVVNAEVEKLMNQATDCYNHLKEIALMPNPQSTPEYISMLIEAEKSEARPGWEERIQSLMHDKEKSESEKLAELLRLKGDEIQKVDDHLRRLSLSLENEIRKNSFVNTALRLAGCYGGLLAAVYYVHS